MRGVFLLAIGVTLLVGCTHPVVAQATGTSNPVFVAKNVGGYVETAAGLPPDTAYGWDLQVAAGIAHWRECTRVDECGDVVRERPAADLVGFAHAGSVERDGREVEVLSLSLAARPRYIVPTKP